MGNYESDANSNNDWDEGWETDWNEFSWEQYLQNESDEVKKYQVIYSKLVRSPNRLDEVALYMGWQSGSENRDDESVQGSSENEDAPPPYTLHRHPLFVSSKALHGWLTDKWARRISLSRGEIDASQALAFQNAVNESDYYGLLAVTALDLDDFALAIAYFKRGMAAVNVALGLLTKLETLKLDSVSLFAKHARIRLFDIREIWLRVTSDCRATISRGHEED